MKDIKEIPPVYLVLIALAAVVAIGYIGFRTMSGGPHPEGPTMAQAYHTIDDMARRTHGDYSKLSKDDQTQIDAFARGKGKDYLSKRYKIITTGEK